MGEKHLTLEYLKHYMTERPHQGAGNELLVKSPVAEIPIPPSELTCSERLGGLLKHQTDGCLRSLRRARTNRPMPRQPGIAREQVVEPQTHPHQPQTAGRSNRS